MENTTCSPAGSAPDATDLLWRSLAQGQWTFVDRFDAGGRRYLIARRARPGEDAQAPSRVEWQALRMRAEGQSLKVIAAELGMSISGASTMTRRAARKLGAREPSELLPLLRQIR